MLYNSSNIFCKGAWIFSMFVIILEKSWKLFALLEVVQEGMCPAPGEWQL